MAGQAWKPVAEALKRALGDLMGGQGKSQGKSPSIVPPVSRGPMNAPYPAQPRQPLRELPDRPMDPFAPPLYEAPGGRPGGTAPSQRLKPPKEASFPGPTPQAGEKWYVDTREGSPTTTINDPTAPTVRRLAFTGQDVRDAIENGEAPILVGAGILKAPPTVLWNKLRQAEQAQYRDPLKNPARISMLEEAKQPATIPQEETEPALAVP